MSTTIDNKGVYIHIPFCNNICIYCDFVSKIDGIDGQKKYVGVLLEEIESSPCEYRVMNDNTILKSDGIKPKIDSIYFGGGTPSSLYTGGIEHIIDRLREKFEVLQDCEITVECNPESIERTKLIEYKRAGVNRISVGLQCADDAVLKLLGRRHTTKEYINATKLVRDYFDNYSTDLILGLPRLNSNNSVHDIVTKSIDTVLSCEPNHISVYALKVEEGTPLERYRYKYDIADDDCVADLYQYTVVSLSKAGFDRYEISNFCIKGCESRHNLKYWKGGDYFGFGVSSAGRHGRIMTKNTDIVDDYLLREGTEFEIVSLQEQHNDYIMLGLRLSNGISLSEYKRLFGVDLLNDKRNEIETLIEQGLLTISDDNLFIPSQYLYVSNGIILKLLG
ncbi:MAG: radical SAM family heme chaperone HemW [Firmicutes bacterium]|nr:radical SAM family heme chaperone HemW [Bacillota bacterium]MCL1953603.1 radical SAM family heme chaperone HemW [Bacillota bacterium]